MCVAMWGNFHMEAIRLGCGCVAFSPPKREFDKRLQKRYLIAFDQLLLVLLGCGLWYFYYLLLKRSNQSLKMWVLCQASDVLFTPGLIFIAQPLPSHTESYADHRWVFFHLGLGRSIWSPSSPSCREGPTPVGQPVGLRVPWLTANICLFTLVKVHRI